jgi:hypothetical protein
LHWFFWNVVHISYCRCQIYYHLVHIVVCNHNVISAIHFFIYAHVPIMSWIHCVLAHFVMWNRTRFL